MIWGEVSPFSAYNRIISKQEIFGNNRDNAKYPFLTLLNVFNALISQIFPKKNYILTKSEKSKKEYQWLMILIFSILLLIYYYFTKDSYDDILELKPCDSNKRIVLRYASFIGSFLILISGIIFLIIAIVDDNIDTEIAFN